MEIIYSRAAVKTINSLDGTVKRRIRAGIEKLPKGDIKPLRGSPGSYRLRVGDLRVLFSYQNQDKILIEKIGSRGGIYKGA